MPKYNEMFTLCDQDINEIPSKIKDKCQFAEAGIGRGHPCMWMTVFDDVILCSNYKAQDYIRDLNKRN